jgi:hypothetical protein
MDESDRRISFNILNNFVISLSAAIGASGSPLGPHPERDLATDLHSGSTPITIKDESNRRIRFRWLQEIYNITTRSDQGIGLSSRNPFEKDLATDLYSGSIVAAHYDEMSPSDSSELFRSLNTYPISLWVGTTDSVTYIKGTLQFNNKNDKSQKRDDVLLIWSDALPQLSIGQPPDRHQKEKCCQTHTACIDQWIILAYM